MKTRRNFCGAMHSKRRNRRAKEYISTRPLALRLALGDTCFMLGAYRGLYWQGVVAQLGAAQNLSGSRRFDKREQKGTTVVVGAKTTPERSTQ
mmetsp:Transcript_15848/g.45499  ORF Transcript_15848/g.45499 Transcript_15848/m.45499 type:complete len:93 (-) Transcript_15848:864-1142(-)